MKRRGATLADTLVCLLLLGTVVGAIFNLFPLSLLAGDRANRRQEAQLLADSRLEGLHAQPFARLQTHSLVKQERLGAIACQLTEEVFAIPGHNPQQILGLRCRVRWQERTGPCEVENEVWVSCVRP